MDFLRQTNIYNPETHQSKILILGAGSTGSFTALTLAKMGLKNIKVIDFDVVEEHNIPNQFYRLNDIGKLKVEALFEIIKDFTGTEIEIEIDKIEENTELDLDMNTIIISCLDNMETRKIVFDKIKNTPTMFIDTRFGGEGYSVHIASMLDDEQVLKLQKGLNAPTMETPCGEKSIIYTINSMASEVCKIVQRIIKTNNYPLIMRREMKKYKFISNLK